MLNKLPSILLSLLGSQGVEPIPATQAERRCTPVQVYSLLCDRRSEVSRGAESAGPRGSSSTGESSTPPDTTSCRRPDPAADPPRKLRVLVGTRPLGARRACPGRPTGSQRCSVGSSEPCNLDVHGNRTEGRSGTESWGRRQADRRELERRRGPRVPRGSEDGTAEARRSSWRGGRLMVSL